MDDKLSKDKYPLRRGRLISTDLETFFTEWKDIQNSDRLSYHPGDTGVEKELTPEDKEEKEVQEQIAWLADAGMENIVEMITAGPNLNGLDFEASLAWMSVKQASVVRKRVFSVQNTIRRRNAKKRDPKGKDNASQASDNDPTPYDNVDSSLTKTFYEQYDNIIIPPQNSATGILDSCEVPTFELHASNPMYDSLSGSTQISGLKQLPRTIAKSRPVVRKGANYRTNSFSPEQQENEYDTIVDIVSMPLTPSSPNHRNSFFPKRTSLNRSTSDNQLSLSNQSFSSATSDCCFFITRPQDADGLPEAHLVHEDEGITRIGDLHPLDYKKIGSLALIELTAILDNYSLPLNKRKAPRMRHKENGVFGVSIEQMLVNDLKRRPHYKGNIPLFLEEICQCLEKQGLSEEGILRVPGNAARTRKKIEEIESLFNNGRFSWEGIATKDLSSMLKQFLRDMPSPLVTFEFLETFLEINSVPDQLEKLKALNCLILTLPLTHSACLKRILQFVTRVVEQSDENKMTQSNCSLVMAPNLFYTPVQPTPVSGKLGEPSDEIQRATATTDVVKMLIKYHRTLWVDKIQRMINIIMQGHTRLLSNLKVKRIIEFVSCNKYEIPNQLISILRMQTDQQDNNLPGVKKHPRRWKIFRMGTSATLSNQSNPMIQDNMINNTLVVRLQSPLFVQKSRAIKVDESLTAGEALQEYNKHFKFHKETVNNYYPLTRQKCYGCFGQNHFPETIDLQDNVQLEDLHIYEYSGNLRIRRLDNNAMIHSVRSINPQGIFIVLPDSFPDPNRLLQER